MVRDDLVICRKFSVTGNDSILHSGKLENVVYLSVVLYEEIIGGIVGWMCCTRLNWEIIRFDLRH